MFDLVGQRRRVVFIAGAGTYDLARVIIRTVGREGEDLRHVYPIVMPEHRVGELHPIALRLMPRRQLHQREIRKMMPVDIYEAYSHDNFMNFPFIFDSLKSRIFSRP